MIYVIADDLTGAAEIAGVCLRFNIPVSFGIDQVPEDLKMVTIIATDSRSLTEKEAYAVHLRIAEQIDLKDGDSIFKKCDSVLRGFIIAEFIALMKRFKKNRALLQPANPKTERCIKAGYYFVNGDLIENTGFAKDPDFPALYSHVKELLLHHAKEFKINGRVYSGAISEISSPGIFLPNCYAIEDLKQSIALYNDTMLIGGSAAFFECFIKELGFEIPDRHSNTKPYKISGGYVLVSGSTFPESSRFAENLSHIGVEIITFPDSLLQPKCEDKTLDKVVKQAINTYKIKGKLVIRISNENIQFKQSSVILKQRLSAVLNQFISEIKIDELFIEGGATAYDALKTLGWTELTPTLELGPGVVRFAINKQSKTWVTIKPGSYKWPKNSLN